MELGRRDVLAALAAAGVGSAAGCSGGGEGTTESASGGATANEDGRTNEDATASGTAVSEHEVDTLIALAEVVYPSEAENVGAFVRDYSAERVGADEAYARGVREAVTALDDYVSEWHDGPYASLSAGDRRDALDHMTVDTADPDPEGVASERIRYYLVNELLYAFYATPTGAGLAGLENPPGHPGGARSYRRGPEP